MNRQVRNTSANQSVHHTCVRRIHQICRIVSTEEVGVALRPEHTDCRNWLPIYKVLLVLFRPPHDRDRRVVHAAILVVCGDIVPPRLDPASHTGDHPHTSLWRGFTRNPVVTGTRLVHRHTFRSQLVPAKHAVNSLAGVTVLLKPGIVITTLMIEHENAGPLRDRTKIAERSGQRRNRTTHHAGPDAVGSSGGTRRSIVQFPDFGSAVVTPENPFAINGIVPVGLFGQLGARLVAELSGAIIAIADVFPTQSRPAVVREAIGT